MAIVMAAAVGIVSARDLTKLSSAHMEVTCTTHLTNILRKKDKIMLELRSTMGRGKSNELLTKFNVCHVPCPSL